MTDASDDWRTRGGLRVKETAKALDCGYSTVWKLIRAGKLKTFPLSREQRVTTASISALIEGRVEADREAA